MNKTYRIKYNQHTGAYVAVAEISTARGKSGGSGRLVAAALLAAGLGISSTAAGAIPWGDGQDIRACPHFKISAANLKAAV